MHLAMYARGALREMLVVSAEQQRLDGYHWMYAVSQWTAKGGMIGCWSRNFT